MENYIKIIEEFKSSNSSEINLGNSNIADLSVLKDFKHLQEIDLRDTLIEDLTPLKHLVNLERLDVRSTKVNDLTPIKDLKNLQVLFLNHTFVSNLSPLKNLRKLQVLILSNTSIQDLSPLAGLLELQILYIDNTNVSSLYPLKNLIKKDIEVRHGRWGFSSGHGIFIENCPLINPSLSSVAIGTDAILNYFDQMDEQNSEPIYEARLLIVGEPGAGKTSLMKKIKDPTYEVYENNKESESTVGINIFNGWSFPYTMDKKQIYKANLWDFGGQEIQYMTHQFFLSGRSLYVLVADNRSQNTNFPFWFEAIHLFGKDSGNIQSPILVILNEKNHKSVTNYNHIKFCEQYPNTTIKYLNLDLSITDNRFNEACLEIQEMLSNLKHIGNKLPKLWIPIREDLQKISETNNYITYDTMKEVCSKRGLFDNLSISVLCGYLHDLGIILNFQEDRSLRDFIVLNPDWAVDAVYSILKDDRVDKNTGRFNEIFLSEIWDGKYSFTEQKNLLSLMMKDNFEICFEYQEGQFVAPQFFKDIKIDYSFDSTDSIKFYFQYDFMPKGIITRLIVRLNEFIDTEESQSLVSKKSVIFKKDGCRAFVRESDFENKGEIKIDVNGKTMNRREVMWWIRNEIKFIHTKWFNSIDPKIFIPCNCRECKNYVNPHFYHYNFLQKCLEKGKAFVTCEKSLLDIEVISLIDGIFTANESKSIQYQLGRMMRKMQKEIEELKKEVRILSDYVENLSIDEIDRLNDLINQKFEILQSELPREIIIEWKEAMKVSAYKADNKDKLKLTLPIIPKIIVYEKEISVDTRKIFEDFIKNLRAIREGKKTFKELFIETT